VRDRSHVVPTADGELSFNLVGGQYSVTIKRRGRPPVSAIIPPSYAPGAGRLLLGVETDWPSPEPTPLPVEQSDGIPRCGDMEEMETDPYG
jgi:hypothetical protein